MKRFGKTGSLFVVLGLAILIFGIAKDSVVDINIHDTYYVISSFYLSAAFSVIFWIIATIYLIFEKWNKPLGKTLGYIHFFLTAIMIIANVYISFTASGENYEHMSEEMEYYGNINALISLFVLIGLLGQLLFLINIVLSVFRKRA